MREKFGIITGGVIAAFIAVGAVELVYNFTEGVIAGRLIALVITIVCTGLLYALTYTLTDARDGDLNGVAAGVFAGAIGGILSWAIGEALFGPFALTGLLVVALIGGLLFSAQIDPKQV